MDVNGMLPEHFTEDTLIHILDSAGKDVIKAAQLRKNEKE
jgi:hypothetical protein